jgi:hypothetical protein
VPVKEIITNVFALLGVGASVLQIYQWITGRRKARALDKFLVSLVDKEDADAARSELAELHRRLDQVSRQQAEIRRSLPRMARDLYARERIRTVTRSIASDYRELRKLQSQIAGGPVLSDLSAEAQEFLDDFVSRPLQRLRRRRIALAFISVTACGFTIFVSPSNLEQWVLGPPTVVVLPFVYLVRALADDSFSDSWQHIPALGDAHWTPGIAIIMWSVLLASAFFLLRRQHRVAKRRIIFLEHQWLQIRTGVSIFIAIGLIAGTVATQAYTFYSNMDYYFFFFLVSPMFALGIAFLAETLRRLWVIFPIRRMRRAPARVLSDEGGTAPNTSPETVGPDTEGWV